MLLNTDEGALLAAMTAAPTDDAPRLVYADWLQERGEETKAEYLRTVVRLIHPPEEAADVARCVALAADLDRGWRHRVGGRFEVMLEGSAPMMVLAHLIRVVLNIAQNKAAEMWRAGEPVRLQTGLTREDADEMIRSFGTDKFYKSTAEEPPLKFSVRPMTEESGPTLFAPRD